ncbi:MAG: type II secretion system protein GspE [Actinobacteria bacterium QS_8_72_14]|nr:MAG: type II secretion system protein GspE [Actinobacteria bacterium QS_8_72_14]
MPNAPQPLADVLLQEALVSQHDLDRALARQAEEGGNLGRALIDLGALDEQTLVATLARRMGMDFVDLSDQLIDPAVASLVPERVARRHWAIPVRIDDDGYLVVAMSDPSNVVALDDVRTVAQREVRAVVATRGDVEEAIERFLTGEGNDIDRLDVDVDDDDHEDLEQIEEVVDEAPVVKFVNQLIARAVQDRASDIHLEPQERATRVRTRVDGVLHEIMTQPRKTHAAIVSRLKIMGELDIAEKRIPQDGRIKGRFGGKHIDLRVSTLPTVHGEKVVMRILDKSSVLMDLGDLGFLTDNFERYQASFTKPYGMILVTGPTGSGKSTTLYATLNVLNKPAVNIVTTEDPVEYQLPGISQVQINPKANLTFPAALRSILRQDPDIVLVGEMRDRETAAIGMEAALTGHLVLSTLHTNDAPSAVTRLTEMGIDPFLVSASVDCVLAQRLLRQVCPKCREPELPSGEELRTAGFNVEEMESIPTVYRAVGCGHCSQTGYRGRLAVHEVMSVTEEVQRLIVERAPTEDIRKFAVAQGMAPLRADGLAKVLHGETTLEEVSRVVV